MITKLGSDNGSRSVLKDFLRLQIDFGFNATELSVGLVFRRLLDRVTPKGDGMQPVLTLPGFNASERTMAYLNRFLNRNGFVAQDWGLGTNQGPGEQNYEAHVEQLSARLREPVESLADRYGRGVALVGQSLGGVDAREVALRLDGHIDRVITLGAPTFNPDDLRPHNAILRLMGERQAGRSLKDQFGPSGAMHWPADYPAKPCVAIHSPIDAAVDERATTIPDSIVSQSRAPAIRENVRVLCSHGGMAVNPFVLLVVADRLVADIDDWQGFDPRRYSNALLAPLLRAIYGQAHASQSTAGPKVMFPFRR